VLVKFFRSSFATQYIATGILGVALWVLLIPAPPLMPAPSGPVPLYAVLYNLLSGLPVVASFLGLVIVLVSAFWLNDILTRNEIIPKNSSLAAFLFVLLSFCLPGQMTLTPVNISILLLIYLLRSLFQAYTKTEPVDLAFTTGFMIAIASLFYLPMVFFYGFLLTSFIIYRSMNWREWFSSLIGLITPGLFLATWYFWKETTIIKVKEYIGFITQVTFSNPWNNTATILPSAFVILFAILGLWYSLNHISEKTVEIRKKIILLFWLIVWTVITFPFAHQNLLIHSGIAMISISALTGNFYLALKKTRIWSLVIWAFIITLFITEILNSLR